MNSGLSKGLLEGLERSENIFQAKMKRIYEKYDHAFEEDIVVNIIDFTYNAPDGPIPWDCETQATGERKHKKGKTPKKEQRSAVVQVFSSEDSSRELSEEAHNTTWLLPKETSDDICSRTFIIEENSEVEDSNLSQLEHYKHSYTTGNPFPSIKFSAGTKETCLIDGHTQALMPYTGSNLGNKTFFVSPLDTSVSVQIKSFIRRQNKDCSFEDTTDISYNDFQADDSRLQYCKETAHCDSGDTSLANYYPDMVECIRRLWELPWKKRAADNIVQYYKRHVWNAYKKSSTKQSIQRLSNFKKMHMHPLRNSETKECTKNKHTLCQSKHLKKNVFMESEVHSPRNKTFAAKSNKDDNSKHLDTFFTKQIKTDTSELGSCTQEKNRQLFVTKVTPVRRNISSFFPLTHSPNAKSKTACKILDETFTYQNPIETDDGNAFLYHNKSSQPSEVKCERNVLPIIQEFPVFQSPRKTTLSSSMESKVESYNTGSFYLKKHNRQTFNSKKQSEMYDVNSSVPENVKWYSKMADTPPRSPDKHGALLKCRIDLQNPSWDNTFTYQNILKMNESFNIQEEDEPLPESSFSAFPVLRSPSKYTITLSSSMESKATSSYKSLIKPNQEESYKTDSQYTIKQKRQTFVYKNQPETHDVNSSLLENVKWFPKVEGTPNRMSPGKQGALVKCRVDPKYPSLNNTFSCQNSPSRISPGKHSALLKCKVDPKNTCLNNTFRCQNSPNKTSPGKPNALLKRRVDPKNTSLNNTFSCQNSVEPLDKKEQDKKPLHMCSLIRRNSFSALPIIRSPKRKSFFNLHDTTVSLDKTVTYEEDLKSVEIAASCKKLEDPQAIRNSFSTSPVVYNLVKEKKTPNVMFEDMYRMENLNGSHPHFRLQSSELVWSLVNSPGSRRSKRQASNNFCFSALKRQKSADETFIQSNIARRSMDNSSLFCRETTDSLSKPSPKFSGWS